MYRSVKEQWTTQGAAQLSPRGSAAEAASLQATEWTSADWIGAHTSQEEGLKMTPHKSFR